jgi:hypothetical protein
LNFQVEDDTRQRPMNLLMHVAGQLIGIHSEMEACRICRIVLNDDRRKDIDCSNATDKRMSPKRNGVFKKAETHAQHRTVSVCWKLVASVDLHLTIRKRPGEHRRKETVTHNPVETFHKLKRLEKRFQLFHQLASSESHFFLHEKLTTSLARQPCDFFWTSQ